MNKTFYAFAIFYLLLTLVCSIFQSVLYLRLENQIFAQESFANWFLATYLVGLVASLLMLKYYHAMNYRFAFKAGVAFTASTFIQFIIMCCILFWRDLISFYLPVAFLAVVVGMIYAISLMSSNAGKRRWLKTDGVFMLVVSIVLFITGIGSITSQDVGVKTTLQKIVQYVSIAYTLGPVFFILNFLSELRDLKSERETYKLSKLMESLLTLGALTAFISVLILSSMLSTQSNSFLSWQKGNQQFGKEILARHYEARVFVNSKGDTMRYQFMKPLDYDPQKKYPLVLCLHHGGTHGTDNFSQLGADPAPFLSSNRDKYPAFFLMPQCPQGMGWLNIDAAIFSMIDSLENEFNIDEKRRYVLGISGGGYGSWHFITARPEMFAAAIPICGGGDVKLVGKIVDVPVWAFHGEEDNLVPVKLSREMVDGIRKAGGSPKYTEFPDAGHNIWNQVVATPGLMEWMFAQRRDSLP